METLRRLRTEKGLSQARLAARAELDPSTVNQIERGAREASPATLRKLADALDVSIADLLEDTSPKALRRSSLEPSLLNGLEEERRPTATQLEAIKDLKGFCDVLEESVHNEWTNDEIALTNRLAMHAYLKVLMLLAEDEATLPALRPVALRFKDLASKYTRLIKTPDEETERGVVYMEEYLSRRAG